MQPDLYYRTITTKITESKTGKTEDTIKNLFIASLDLFTDSNESKYSITAAWKNTKIFVRNVLTLTRSKTLEHYKGSWWGRSGNDDK